MNDARMLSETEKLLLMAAGVHGLGPGTDLGRANTARVVNQALLWLGVSREEIDRAWEALEADEPEQQRDSRPSNEEVYDALIRMTWVRNCVGAGRAPEQGGTPLFEGNGNWGVPSDPTRPACLPHYNSCRLTEHGERIARELLTQYPRYGSSGEPGAPPDGPPD